jgi:hypothetical protein
MAMTELSAIPNNLAKALCGLWSSEIMTPCNLPGADIPFGKAKYLLPALNHKNSASKMLVTNYNTIRRQESQQDNLRHPSTTINDNK